MPRRSRFSTVVTLAVLASAVVTTSVVSSEVGAGRRIGITDDGTVRAGAANPAATIGYFATNPSGLSAARLVAAALTDGERLAAAELRLTGVEAVVVSVDGRFAYVGGKWGTTPTIVKVRTLDMTVVDSVDLTAVDSADPGSVTALALSADGLDLIVGATSAGTDMWVLDAATLDVEVSADRLTAEPRNIIVHPTAGTAAVSTLAVPAEVLTIDTTDLSVIDGINLPTGYGMAGVANASGSLAWFATWTSPAQIHEFDTSTGSVTRSLTLSADLALSLRLSADEQTLYVGTDTSPAKVVAVDLSATDLTEVASLTLADGENVATSLLSAADGALVVGTFTVPSRLVRVSTDPLARLSGQALLAGQTILSITPSADGRLAYVVTEAQIGIFRLSDGRPIVSAENPFAGVAGLRTAIDHDTHRLFIATSSGAGIDPGPTVKVIDLDDLTVVDTFSLDASLNFLQRVVHDAATDSLVVAGGNGSSFAATVPLDGSSPRTVDIGTSYVEDLVLDPEGGSAYVLMEGLDYDSGNFTGSRIAAVDLASMTVTDTAEYDRWFDEIAIDRTGQSIVAGGFWSENGTGRYSMVRIATSSLSETVDIPIPPARLAEFVGAQPYVYLATGTHVSADNAAVTTLLDVDGDDGGGVVAVRMSLLATSSAGLTMIYFPDDYLTSSRAATVDSGERSLAVSFDPSIYLLGVASLRTFDLWGLPSDVAPSLPGTPRAVPRRGSVDLSWQRPTSTTLSGRYVSRYQVAHRRVGTSAWSLTTTAASPTPTASVTGLVDGVSYEFRVRAVNPMGSSPWSAVSNAVIVGRPSAPRSVAVAPRPAGARITWSIPSSGGGSAITGYRVQRSRDGITWTTAAVVAASARSVAISGLTPGISYRVRVTARNAGGWGLPSRSVTVVPTT